MHRSLLFTALCLLAVISTGCKKAQLRRQLKELMGSTIVLPEKISCVYNGEVYPMPDSLRKRSKLIVYIDSSECTLCRIAHLGEYQIIFNLANQNKGFDVMLLLSNQELGPIPLTRYLADLELPYPVYVDTEKMFILKNQFIPKDNRLHSFFLDESGRPQFVGDPSSSSYMLKAFKQYLYSFL